MKFTKTHENIVVFLLLVAGFFFWNTLILFPFKIFAVLFHEIFHTLSVMASGGGINSVVITENLGGVTSSLGGNETAVLLLGYPGAVIAGTLIYLFSQKEKYNRYFLPFISLILILFGFFIVKNSFGKIVSISAGIILIPILFIRSQTVKSIILRLIALFTISYVFYDVISDTFLTTNLYSDAVRLQQITGVNDWIWGSIWMLVALIPIYFFFMKSFKKGK